MKTVSIEQVNIQHSIFTMKTKSLCIQAPVYSSDLKALYKSVIIIFLYYYYYKTTGSTYRFNVMRYQNKETLPASKTDPRCGPAGFIKE